LAEIAKLPIGKSDKQEIELQLKPLRDVLADKREQALLDLSDDDRGLLDQLQMVLKERRQRRAEIRVALDDARKLQGGSGLDFERALAAEQQVKDEKERLEKVNEGIAEVEARIKELQAKVGG
ncbi:MAG: hypothetical protein KDK78_08410, partial [Chlamydiia bacterium]|nr:hypothetical protein [Chlamydiia bacterium]